MQYIQQPQAIEAKSFDIISEIIAETRPDYRFASPLHEAIIKRVIHTTADFDWLDILWFSPDALIALSEALSRPCTLYTDTTMALSGINKTLLARFGGECRCYISDPRVVREAQSRGMTRSMAAVDMRQPRCFACWNIARPPSAAWWGCRSGSSARRSRKRRSARAACRPSPRSAAKGEATWRQRL